MATSKKKLTGKPKPHGPRRPGSGAEHPAPPQAPAHPDEHVRDVDNQNSR